jgi:hypothetical protein
VLIGGLANSSREFFGKMAEIFDQHLTAVEIDLHASRLKERAQGGAEAQAIKTTDKSGDMLPKALHKCWWKTASAESFFFHSRSKLASWGGLSIGPLESQKCASTFPPGKVTVTAPQEVGAQVKRQTE